MPKELKDRMDLVNADRWIVNWSEVAQKAFERELRKHERKPIKENEMDAVVERLRESQEEYRQDLKVVGFQDGANWAMKGAEYVELKRLGETYTDIDPEVSCIDLARTAQGVDDSGFSENEDILYRMGITDPDELGSEEYASGFLAGALDVWMQAEGLLD